MIYFDMALARTINENCSKKKLRNGTLLFTKDLNNNDPVYSSRIYQGLKQEVIEKVALNFNNFPQVYKDFLTDCNGLFLFNGRFYLYGKAFLEKGMSREEQIYQPYDLIEENEDPPMKIDEDLFYFGGTPESIFVFEKDGKIVEISRKRKTQINSYPNFKLFYIEKLNQDLPL